MVDDLHDLKKLWQIAFGDSAQYTDFYFSRRYRPENTQSITADGHVVSSAQFFPYAVTYGGQTLDGVYILGVCTHPDYRRRGYTSALMKRILLEQYDRGTELAFLLPQEPYLFDVYGKYGFGRLFTVHREYAVRGGSERHDGYHILDAQPEEMFAFYDRFYRSLNSAVCKSYDDFVFAMDEIRMGDGRVLLCGDSEIRGFAVFENGVVKELLCEDTLACDTLLSALFEESGSSELTVVTPGDDASIGMARVLRPAAFLEKTTKGPVSIRLTDPLIPQNSGVYTVRDGVTFSETGAFDLALTISELPAYCMKRSYANWLLN